MFTNEQLCTNLKPEKMLENRGGVYAFLCDDVICSVGEVLNVKRLKLAGKCHSAEHAG